MKKPQILILIWLASIAALVYAIILVGGATRLTDSGLSITEWQPFSGAIPPLSETEWQNAFSKYQLTQEFKTHNYYMKIDEFRYIYWWEWGHRQLGRLIGISFLLPFLAFLFAGYLSPSLIRKLLLLLALGGLQAAIGWWMVASGIGTSRTDVSPYRLMTHFALAITILGLCTWIFLSILNPVAKPAPASWKLYTMTLLCLLCLQMLAGSLTAGLDGGMIHNDWPLMSGYWLPPPSGLPLLENAAAAQASHRFIAYILLTASAIAAIHTRHTPFILCLTLLLLQATLGIITLIYAAPLPLALLHQAAAIPVFLFILALAHRYLRKVA